MSESALSYNCGGERDNCGYGCGDGVGYGCALGNGFGDGCNRGTGEGDRYEGNLTLRGGYDFGLEESNA